MQNNQNKQELIREWTSRSENDESSIITALKYKEGSPAIACFLSQQMSEKYLKALDIILHRRLSKSSRLA